MPTSDITITGTPKEVLTVGDPSIQYRPTPVKGKRYVVNVRKPEPPKRG